MSSSVGKVFCLFLLILKWALITVESLFFFFQSLNCPQIFFLKSDWGRPKKLEKDFVIRLCQNCEQLQILIT